MKTCNQCGKQVDDQATVCPECGANLQQRPAPAAAPVKQLKTNRALWKVILLSLVTFGIYGIITLTDVGNSLNTVAAKRDGKRTMHFCLLFFLIGPLTLGIGTLVWFTKMSARVGQEKAARNLPGSFGAGTFWGWGILGAIIIVGPFVYMAKLLRSMNAICADYNSKG